MSDAGITPTHADDARPFGELFAEGTRNGLTRPKAVRGAGVKMVNMGELFAYPRLRNAPMDRVPLSEAEADRFLLEPGDLLFARQSLVLEGAGKCSIFLSDDEPVTFESHITRVRLDSRKADPRFYFYYLQSHHGRAAITSIVEQGAGASGIRGSDLERLGVLWLPLSEQCAIAEVLGAFDDKIEQNRRTARALERLARAIFHAWFVDFEPVKAKAAGATAFPSMPQPVFDDLPTRFVDSAIGPVPESWEVKSFGDVLVLQYGKAMKANDRQPGQIPVYGSNGQVGWHNEAIAAGPGIIVGRKGNPGTVKWSQGPFFPIDTTFFVQLANGGASIPLLFHQLQAADLNRLAADSAVPGVNRNMIYGERCVVPRDMTLGAFDELVLGLRALQTQLMHECNKLVAMRDYLLPKLLNGDVRVGSLPQEART